MPLNQNEWLRRQLPPGAIEEMRQRYVAGDSARAIARAYGVSHSVVMTLMRRLGLPTVSREERNRQRARHLPDAEIVRRHLAGESTKALAREYGTVPSAVVLRLQAHGVKPRTLQEAQQERLRCLSPQARAAMTQAAHEAVRGSKRSHEELCRRAQGRAGRRDLASAYEEELAALLAERGITVVFQHPIGPYNCDLGAYPVAVEVFGGYWHWTGRHLARTPKRLRYLFGAGWHVLIVQAARQYPITGATADYVATYIQEARRDPTRRREYRVIRRAGELLATGCTEHDDLTIIDAFRRRRDPDPTDSRLS